MFVFVRGQRDVAVLYEVDDHPPLRLVGRGRDEDGLTDLEQRGSHGLSIGTIWYGPHPNRGSLDGFRRTSDG
jgi:hypothetical protein